MVLSPRPVVGLHPKPVKSKTCALAVRARLFVSGLFLWLPAWGCSRAGIFGCAVGANEVADMNTLVVDGSDKAKSED
jgi:hypothetical protein